MLEIAYCEDNEYEREEIGNYLKSYLFRHRDITAHLTGFSSSRALLDSSTIFDIYFLDIIMPEGPTGIETGKILRERGVTGIILYLTSSKEYAVDSYSTRALDYLVKPISAEAFEAAFTRAISIIKQRSEESLMLKAKSGVYMVNFKDLIYAELIRRNVKYYMAGGNVLKSPSIYTSFREVVSPFLKDKRFILCGSSFMVNLQHIRGIEKDNILMSDGQKLCLPKKAYPELRTAWFDYWVGDTV